MGKGLDGPGLGVGVLSLINMCICLVDFEVQALLYTFDLIPVFLKKYTVLLKLAAFYGNFLKIYPIYKQTWCTRVQKKKKKKKKKKKNTHQY